MSNKHLHCRACVAALFVLAFALSGCGTPAAAPPCLTYGLTLVPSGIDPHVNSSSELGIPLTNVYDTLVYQDPASGAFVPGLAERWEIAPDGTVYTFTLRSDVKFHDGTPFDADAALTNIRRITDPERRSQKALFLLGPFDHADAPDARTLVITLKAPYAPLLDGLSQVYTGMASPAALAKYGDDYPNHQVGTGPFMFAPEGYQSGVGLDLVRNPDYAWGPSVFGHRGPAYLERVCFRFYADPPARALKLASGEAQIVGEIPPAAAAAVEQEGKARIMPVAVPGQPLVVFVNSLRPPTDDLRVRQALLFAANRPAIVDKVFAGRSPLAEGPLSRVTFGYDASVEGLYPYDPARAAALLDAAGWADSDGDGVRDRGGQKLQIDFVIQSWGFMPQISALLEADWKAAGIDVLPPREVTFPQALQIGRDGEFNVMPYTTSGSDPDLLRAFFVTGGSFNWSKASMPAIDAALAEASQSSDTAVRAARYAEVQRAVMDQALVIPIRDYVNLNGVSTQITGLRFDRRGWFPWLVDVQWKR